MEGLSELLATADELYGLLPEAFTAARDERARALRRDGSRARALAVKELRRPSIAAWLVNALVRHRADEVEELLTLGDAMRDAQGSLDAGQLRDLNRRRQAVLSAISQEARTLARDLGRPVSDTVVEEVEATLRAGLADPAAANAIRSGRLTASLSYVGFGEADMSGVVAVAGAPVHDHGGRVPTARAGTREAALREATMALNAAAEAARRAQGAALVAEQHRDGLLRRATSARDRLDHAYARVAELESLLAAAREAASAAAAGWAPLHAEAEAAVARAEAARGVADSAAAMLESARAHHAEVERAGP